MATGELDACGPGVPGRGSPALLAHGRPARSAMDAEEPVARPPALALLAGVATMIATMIATTIAIMISIMLATLIATLVAIVVA